MIGKLRLCLVEDDNNVALVVQKTLERAGHQVLRCRSGQEALDRLQQDPFDLILLDHYLPDMAGLEFLDILHREKIATPALMVTAYGDEHLATKVLHAGALDYVVKDPSMSFLAELPKRVNESVMRHRLQRFNRLLVEALESARDGILITDHNGIILHINRSIESMLGYSRGDILGSPPSVFRGDLDPIVFAGLDQAINDGYSWQGEMSLKRKDGIAIDVSLTVAPIEENGQTTHFVGIFRDISERQQLQRQLAQAQKMQSIGTLASGVAHEFNNLLAGISGYASLGKEESPNDSPIREYLQQIVTLSERAANLTRQLLAFARKPMLFRQPMPMDELMQGTADLVKNTTQAKVELELESTDGSLQVEADIGQLQQALVNLALNARDAQDAQTPIVFRLRSAHLTGEVKSFPENVPPGSYVILEVADHGTGMPPEVLTQSLDPFYSTKDVGQGTGLGLPVAFGIVHAHHGFMTIDSAPNQGTRVQLHLPRHQTPS